MNREFNCNYKGELHFSWYSLEDKNVENEIPNCDSVVVQEIQADEVWFWQVFVLPKEWDLPCTRRAARLFLVKQPHIASMTGKMRVCQLWLTAKWQIFTRVLLPKETKGWRKLLLRIREGRMHDFVFIAFAASLVQLLLRKLSNLTVLCALGKQSGNESWKSGEKTSKKKAKYIDWGLKMMEKMKTILGMEILHNKCSLG